MSALKSEKKLETELAAMLAEAFSGISVTVEHLARWDRMGVTFRWSGFAELLPEERFRRLVSHIPEEFREKHLAGFVWLELAPNETVDEFLRLPRSEDVAGREAKIFRALVAEGVIDTIRKAMRPTPSRACKGDFSFTIDALSSSANAAERIRDAKLLFMRHGAYCDCQAVDTVAPELQKSVAPSR